MASRIAAELFDEEAWSRLVMQDIQTHEMQVR
jgi:hypothetical protein